MPRRAIVGLLATTALSSIALSGCAQLTSALSDPTTIVGLGLTVTTGKGLSDHVLSIVTGEDCNLGEGLTRSDRDVCEEEGSLATESDFKGIFALAREPSNKANAERDPGEAWAVAQIQRPEPQTEISASKTEAVTDEAAVSYAVMVLPRLELKPEWAPQLAGVQAVTEIPRLELKPEWTPPRRLVRLELKPEAPRIQQAAWDGSGGPLVAVLAEGLPEHVRHNIEYGEPVVVVRLIPVAMPPQQAQSEMAAPQPADYGQETLSDALPASAVSGDYPAQEQTEAAASGQHVQPVSSEPAAPADFDAAPEPVSPVARFLAARPALKPDLENGVGGALDIAPPRNASRSVTPKPMRLDTIEQTQNGTEKRTPKKNQKIAKAKPDPLDLPATSRPILPGAAIADGQTEIVTPTGSVGLPMKLDPVDIDPVPAAGDVATLPSEQSPGGAVN
jgi:hypothetical protein